jgi:predicted permease
MQQAFLDGSACVATVFIILAAGFLLERLGWFADGREELLARLVVWLGLPCTVFYGFVSSFTRSDLLSLGWGLGLPLAVVLANLALSMLLARAFRVREGRHSVFVIAFSFGNSVFIGVPVALALFGEETLPLTMLTFVVNTVVFWTLGVWLMRRESVRTRGGEIPENEPVVKKIARIFQPATVAFALAIGIILTGWEPPGFAMSAVRYMGYLVTPLSLIYSGAIIGRLGLGCLRPDRDVALTLLGRFAWAPLLAIGVSMLVPLPELTRKLLSCSCRCRFRPKRRLSPACTDWIHPSPSKASPSAR